MSDVEPFPELIEGRRLNAERINGVDPARLTIGAERDAVVTFQDEVAALQNVLGVYLIDPDGTIRDPEIVFARIEHADPLPGLPLVRPGGGPLEPGDAVHLNTLYPAADLQPGQEFGLFVVADGADLNPGFVFEAAVSSSSSTPRPAVPRTSPMTPPRSSCATSRTTAACARCRGRSSTPPTSIPTRSQNDLNPGGAERVVSGTDATTGALLLGFEDLRDFDFNDVVVGLGPIVVPPPVEVPPASLADLDGTNGFRLDGIDAATNSGFSVAGAGDVNGDGFGDRHHRGSRRQPRGQPGESYVVFGRASGFGASLDLASLDGTNGFRLQRLRLIYANSGARSPGPATSTATASPTSSSALPALSSAITCTLA